MPTYLQFGKITLHIALRMDSRGIRTRGRKRDKYLGEPLQKSKKDGRDVD